MNAAELKKCDVDQRPQPSKLPLEVATKTDAKKITVTDVMEIDASLNSHPPMKYEVKLAQVSVTDYSNIKPMVYCDRQFYYLHES